MTNENRYYSKNVKIGMVIASFIAAFVIPTSVLGSEIITLNSRVKLLEDTIGANTTTIDNQGYIKRLCDTGTYSSGYASGNPIKSISATIEVKEVGIWYDGLSEYCLVQTYLFISKNEFNDDPLYILFRINGLVYRGSMTPLYVNITSSIVPTNISIGIYLPRVGNWANYGILIHDGACF